MDAGAFGNRLGLDAAYKFARGEQGVAEGIMAGLGLGGQPGEPRGWQLRKGSDAGEHLVNIGAGSAHPPDFMG
jgi:hypothetical protein